MHGAAVPFGLVVRIPGFHPGGPGSIPGVGSNFFFFPIIIIIIFSLQLYRLFSFLLSVLRIFFSFTERRTEVGGLWVGKSIWNSCQMFLSRSMSSNICACAHDNVYLAPFYITVIKFSLSEYTMCIMYALCSISEQYSALCLHRSQYSTISPNGVTKMIQHHHERSKHGERIIHNHLMVSLLSDIWLKQKPQVW